MPAGMTYGSPVFVYGSPEYQQMAAQAAQDEEERRRYEELRQRFTNWALTPEGAIPHGFSGVVGPGEVGTAYAPKGNKALQFGQPPDNSPAAAAPSSGAGYGAGPERDRAYQEYLILMRKHQGLQSLFDQHVRGMSLY